MKYVRNVSGIKGNWKGKHEDVPDTKFASWKSLKLCMFPEHLKYQWVLFMYGSSWLPHE